MKPLTRTVAGEPLAPRERADLARLEMVVSQGIAAFDAVGRALLEIRDRRLYRESHKDFDDYCRRRWGFGKSRGYQLIEAAETAANLKADAAGGSTSTNGGNVGPTNERQVRPLAGLSPDAQRAAWADAVETCEGRDPTAEDVALAVEALELPPDPLEEHQRRSAALKDAADHASPPRDDRRRRLLKILHYARQIKRCARGLGGEGEDLEGLADKVLSIAEDRLAT